MGQTEDVEADADSNDYLSHHRKSLRTDREPGSNARPKDINDAFSQVKRQKGSAKCLNCGASDHVKKDCLEPPRKWNKITRNSNPDSNTQEILRRDERVLDANYDAKRDRWYGYTYDVSQLKRVKPQSESNSLQEMDRVQMEEMERLGLKPEDLGFKSASRTEKTNAVRLRDDKPAYLQDINSEETLYDPKSRIYKSKVDGEINPDTKMFHRHLTGDALKVNVMNEKVRQEASKHGIKDYEENTEKLNHVYAANPTKYELMMRNELREGPASAKDSRSEEVAPKRKRADERTISSSSRIRNLYDKYM